MGFTLNIYRRSLPFDNKFENLKKYIQLGTCIIWAWMENYRAANEMSSLDIHRVAKLKKHRLDVYWNYRKGFLTPKVPQWKVGPSLILSPWGGLSWFSLFLSFWVFGRGWLQIFSLDYESEKSDKLKLSQLEAETGGLTELRDNSASGKHPMTPMHYMLMNPKPPLNPPTVCIPRWSTPQALPRVSRHRHQKWKFELRKPSLLIVLYY